MPDTGHILTQGDIFRDMLEGTIDAYIAGEIPNCTDIIVGASATVFTYRDHDEGFALNIMKPLDFIANLEDDSPLPQPVAHLHSFECRFFLNGQCVFARYENRVLVKQETFPDNAPAGTLFRLGWDNPIPKDKVLTAGVVREIAQQVIAEKKFEVALDIWFNGERVTY